MKKSCFKVIALAILVMTAFSGSICSAADDSYPESPIRWIIPLSAGGIVDMYVRALAPHMEKELDTTIVVENMEGAGTQIGLTALLSAPTDGYTIGSANQPHMSLTVAVQNAGYKESEFAWLNIQQIDPVGICVLPDSPWMNLQELIDDIKAKPGELAIGVGQSSGPHFFLLYLRDYFDLDFVIVPYQGGGEGKAALLGGHIDAYGSTIYADYAIRDMVRCIAVGEDERSSSWPDAPTVYEATGDAEFASVVKNFGSLRGVVVSRKFKEEHPARFEKLLEAYKKAYHSEEHLADADNIGQTPMMRWTGPEEAEKLSAGAAAMVAEYSSYFSE